MVKNLRIQCPYKCEGKIRYTRLIYHLANKCKNIGKFDYEICLYNWVHRVPRGSLEEHYKNCEFKPLEKEFQWNTESKIENWNSGPWNSFLYDVKFPPDFFPDY